MHQFIWLWIIHLQPTSMVDYTYFWIPNQPYIHGISFTSSWLIIILYIVGSNFLLFLKIFVCVNIHERYWFIVFPFSNIIIWFLCQSNASLIDLVWKHSFSIYFLLFSGSVVSDSLLLHGLQQARLLCPSLFPRVCSNSCPLSQWGHPTISSSAAPFSSCHQSFPDSESFPMSQLFTSCGQSIRALASASVLPMNILCCFPLGLTGFISLLSKGLSRVSSSITIQKHQFLGSQPSLWFTSHICSRLLEKLYGLLTTWTFVGKVMSLLSKMFISFPP